MSKTFRGKERKLRLIKYKAKQKLRFKRSTLNVEFGSISKQPMGQS